MELDPLAIRNLLIWIALALGNTILLGATPNWMRCGAKRADPSAASALFALVLAGVLAAFLALTGGAAAAAVRRVGDQGVKVCRQVFQGLQAVAVQDGARADFDGLMRHG